MLTVNAWPKMSKFIFRKALLPIYISQIAITVKKKRKEKKLPAAGGTPSTGAF